MECRAEINRFAIFLLCLLVPLGSMAPTEISESKVTTGQRQKHFTTKISTLTFILRKKAQDLFQFYKKCISATLQPEPWTIRSEARDLVESILTCPVFQADCCALLHIRNILLTLEEDIETLCTQSSKNVLTTNLSQLNTTLSQGTAFYTCSSQDLPQGYPQVQNMTLANRKIYIWDVLNTYEEIMQHMVKLYFEAAV